MSKMLPLGLVISALANLALGQAVKETRDLDALHKAALAEGGVVTLWHGGDEKDQQDFLKQSFEKRFKGMTLNVTVDLSKYHDVRLDQQLKDDAVFVDSIILQTLHDYPRWAKDGALLSYEPVGFKEVNPDYKDESAFWHGVYIFFWSNGWNREKLPGIEAPTECTDFLKPEFKDKLVLTYPHDDDAVAYAFKLIMDECGKPWFDKLMAQNPRWVRGTATPAIVAGGKGDQAAFFATGGGFGSDRALNFSQPTKGKYVSWSQYAGILKKAPHPEGAKLLHNYILSPEYQKIMGTWSVRTDMPTPEGFPDLNQTNTTPKDFATFMADRGEVERLRFWFEAKMGLAEGANPIDDNINLSDVPSDASSAAPNATKACRAPTRRARV